MKILHAADLHIDSPLGGLTAYEGAPVDEIRGSTRRATENLIAAAIEHEVDLVVLAGDIFDGDWRDFSTGLFWVEQLDRLNDEGIQVVSVAGNHDAASEISRNLQLPPNVTQLSETAPERKVFDDLDLEVIGQGYATRSVTDDLSSAFPEPDSGLFTLGLLHTSLDGRPGHADYAPCGVADLRAKGYDYWALGHIHLREEVHTDPWIVFPGNLQGRHAREVGPKGASLVTVESNQVESVDPLELDDVRWHLVDVPAERLADVDEIRSNIAEQFNAIAGEQGQRLAAVRVRIQGSSQAHEELWRDPHGLEADIRSLAIQSGKLWVEKVKLDTTRPLDLAQARADDVVGLLAARIDELKADPDGLTAHEEAFSDLRKTIGADARTTGDSPVDTSHLGTAAHLAEQLDGSLELVVALLAEERA